MNNVSYHHYGASVIDAPIDQLRGNIQAVLNLSGDAQPIAEHAIVGQAGMLDQPCGMFVGIPCSIRSTHKLAEYSATWTLSALEDAPHRTLFEWMREYHSTAPAHDEQMETLISALVEQDRALALRLAAEYGSTEVFYIDYLLGGK